MVKNTTGGSKHKKFAKNRDNNQDKLNIKNLIKSDSDQEYAYIINVLGNCRFNVECSDNKNRLAHMRGKLKKRSWCTEGDIILISLRDFQDDKCDIIQKYTPEQIQILIENNEIPEFLIKKKTGYLDNEVTFNYQNTKNDENNKNKKDNKNNNNTYLDYNLDDNSDSDDNFDINHI